MNDTPLGVEDFSAFRCHYSTGKGMQQVTLLFTVHPAFPWLVTAGLILFASMMILWIELHLPQ